MTASFEVKTKEDIVYETISFKMRKEEKKYVNDIIDIIKEALDCNNKNALLYTIFVFNEFIIKNNFMDDLMTMLKNNKVLELIRDKFKIDIMDKYYCRYLMNVKDLYLCSKNVHFQEQIIEFKLLRSYPNECETCEYKRSNEE